jgi:hypothetical protein
MRVLRSGAAVPTLPEMPVTRLTRLLDVLVEDGKAAPPS